MGYVHAKPLKIVEIRNIAQDVRRFLKLSDNERINAPKLLDALCVLWEDYGFQYMVMPDDDPVFEKGEEAKTDISSGMIYIKESVMYEACHHKYKRAPFTICHEIGHFVLHRMLGGVSLARSTSERKPRAFEDPEWQADTFASEFLMPVSVAKDMSAEQIRKTYCVSRGCAEYHHEKLGGEFIVEDIKKYQRI